MKKEKLISLTLAAKIYAAAKEEGIELPESEYVWLYSEMMCVDIQIKSLEDEYSLRRISDLKGCDIEGRTMPAYDTYECLSILINSSYFKDLTEGVITIKSNNPDNLGKNILFLIKNNLL